MSKPKNHTDECECPRCERALRGANESDPHPPTGDAPGMRRLLGPQDVQWKFDPVRGQWWPRIPADMPFRPGMVLRVPAGHLQRYQKERALLAAVTVWAQRSDEAFAVLVDHPTQSAEYHRAWEAQHRAVAAVDACWRDLQAVGGPLP